MFFFNFYSLIPVNLNQYRATVGVFNNRDSAHCSSFILVSAIFICLVYLCTLIVYLESSFSYIVRVKSRTICGYSHIILHISLLFLYVNHFWFFKINLKLSGDVEENPGPKPSSSQSSLFVTGI